MLPADLHFFDHLADDAYIREKFILGATPRPAHASKPTYNNEPRHDSNMAPLVQVSRSTWRRWVKAGSAPKPVNLSDGVVAWRVGDLRCWLAAQTDSTNHPNSK